MSRILFAWELGGGFGHLSRLEPIARNLRAAGHEVLFVSKDTQCAAKWLGPYGYRFLQAPVSATAYKLTRPPANYTEVLLTEGYAEPTALRGKVEGWAGIYQLYRPDIVVADHSPTALLAARFLDICRVQVGNGFELPPLVRPFPSIRPWESIASALLEHSEATALAAINAVAEIYQGKPLSQITDLFDLNGFTLASFSELDHYGPRQSINYAGPIYPRHHGQKVNWPRGTGPRIFAYLRPSVPGFNLLMAALSQSRARVICVVPGADKNLLDAFSTDSVCIYRDPVDLGVLIGDMDLGMSYGGIGTVTPLLLGGVPVLLAPQNVEQYLFCTRVESLGAGLILRNARSQQAIQDALTRILVEPSYVAAAKLFAARYADFNPDQAVEQAVMMINSVL